MKFRLVKTCSACPEQYDVYLGDRQVGYLRLRNGYFAAYFPDASGKSVYSNHPEGDGMFADESERREHLNAACLAIKEELSKEQENDIYEIESE